MNAPQFETRSKREQLLDHLPEEVRAGLEHAIEMSDGHGRFALGAVEPGTLFVLHQGSTHRLEGMPRAHHETIFARGEQTSWRPITLALGPEQHAWAKAVTSDV